MNVNPFDPSININWPITDYIISDQHKNALNANEAIKLWKKRNSS